MSLSLWLATFFTVASTVKGFTPSAGLTNNAVVSATAVRVIPHEAPSDAHAIGRQRFLATATAALLPTLTSFPGPSHALVKGNAPPPKKKPSNGAEGEAAVKCRNVEECQELAIKAEEARARREAEQAAAGPQPQLAPGGTRYLDLEAGPADGRVARTGDAVEVHYKVLKLGKRSYDGLSGEGTVVFSRGYGLEDDEQRPGDRSFTFTLGKADETKVIRALDDGVLGMAVGGTRRLSVTPQNGWEKNTPACDGGPGGRGGGGDLKTDYVVVPTATMVDQEACFDQTRRPFPTTYAQERRMAQRFDQSLIMEVQLVKVS